MKQFVAVVVLVAALGAAAPAAAQGGARPTAPVVDTFEDGAYRLRVAGFRAGEGAGLSVTLVYEDAETATIETVTVDPELVESAHADHLRAFLGRLDPGFLSFVRATLADRLLHGAGEPRAIDAAESALFFRRKLDRLAHARLAAAVEEGRTAE